jgi:hypothetical protein
MRQFLLSILVIFHFDSYAQTDIKNNNFDKIILEVEGDLNNDKLLDKVSIKQDTLNKYAPYRFQIFFKELNGKSKLIVSSTKLILPQYPEATLGFSNGNGLSSVTIKKGILCVSFELLRGHYEHKFRYKEGNFELIGYSYIASDGLGLIETIDYNLVTGIRVAKTERYDIDKLIRYEKKKLLIRPLPKLQDINPLEDEGY